MNQSYSLLQFKTCCELVRSSAKFTMSNSAGRVLVYGGMGALGSTCVTKLKSQNFWVASIDLRANPEADANYVVKKEDELITQESDIISSVGTFLDKNKLDAVFCVAGGWIGGNAAKDLSKNTELMWKQSVCTSLITATLACQYMKPGGIVVFTGAQAALNPTPGMMGYGTAKAAVHHLVKSIAAPGSGLATESVAVAILPITLDTPMNRKWMPQADTTTWTPLEFIADNFIKWAQGESRPSTGSLLQLITKDSKTEIVPHQ